MGTVLSCLDKTMASRGENPFRNRIVVEELCRYLSFQDLKQCRLVNRLWEELATPLLTPNCSPVKLKEAPSVQQLNDLLSPCFPCTTFSLTCPFYGPRSNGVTDFSVIAFLKNVSPWITELHLGESVAVDGAIMPLQQLANVTFPCLKTLSVTLTDRYLRQAPRGEASLEPLYQEFGDLAPNPEMVVFIASLKPVIFLLECAPNLKEVHVTTHNKWKHFLAFLTILKHYEGRLRITQFQWRGEPERSCVMPLLLLMAETQLLELHSLDLDLNLLIHLEEQFFPGLLFSLLQSQQHTLKSLRIRGGNQRHDHFPLPRMPHLNTLEVVQNHFVCCYEITADKFPALRSLTLFTWEIGTCHERGHAASGVFPLDSVEELRLFSYGLEADLEPSPAAFLQVSQRFPRVKKLSVPAREELLVDVFQVEWPCLEHLTIVCRMWYIIMDQIIEKVASQQLFKQVKVLEIRSEDYNVYNTNRAFSDASARLLLKFNTLTCLDLRRCTGKYLFELSGRLIRRMRKKFTVLL